SHWPIAASAGTSIVSALDQPPLNSGDAILEVCALGPGCGYRFQYPVRLTEVFASFKGMAVVGSPTSRGRQAPFYVGKSCVSYTEQIPLALVLCIGAQERPDQAHGGEVPFFCPKRFVHA